MKSVKFKKSILILLLCAGFWFLTFGLPFLYSVDHAGYQLFEPKITQLDTTKKLDLVQLNRGEWREACLFGGYTHPSEVMGKKGKVSFFDSYFQQLKSWGLLRLGEVEEWESMIAYVDNSEDVHFVHFGATMKSGIGNTLEHFEKCTTRERPWISYP